MPPIRSESLQKSANQEGKILLALDDLQNGRIKSIRAAARLYQIPRSTLQTRGYGVVSVLFFNQSIFLLMIPVVLIGPYAY